MTPLLLTLSMFTTTAQAQHLECRSWAPCAAGWGDCDSDSECLPGLVCENDIGDRYGFSSWVDTCELPMGHGSRCTPGTPCDTAEGDCDADGDCLSGLVCTHDIGERQGFSAATDTCELPLWDWSRCSPGSPCDVGEGDCDADDDCLSGLVCQHDIGLRYQQTRSMDTCELPPGHWDRCSPETPCGDGEGDCEDDDDCLSGLACHDNVGAAYGFAAGVDVCEPLSCPGDFFSSTSTTPTLFRMPVDMGATLPVDPILPEPAVLHVDTNQTRGPMAAFAPGFYTYDNHTGTDYPLDGSFFGMWLGSAYAVAAADGVVMEVQEDFPDHCAYNLDPFIGPIGEIMCEGEVADGGEANLVKVCHADGTVSEYWHLMRDSAVVAVGDEVSCGDDLGLLGSSGYSSMPHLHFEVRQGTVAVDPYAADPRDGMWVEQHHAAYGGLPGPACAP